MSAAVLFFHSRHTLSHFEKCSGLVCASRLVVSDLLLAEARSVIFDIGKHLLVLYCHSLHSFVIDFDFSLPLSGGWSIVHQIAMPGYPAHPAPVLFGSLEWHHCDFLPVFLNAAFLRV